MAHIDPPEPMKTEAVVLEALKVAARSELSPQLAHDLEARMYQDALGFMANRMIFELRTKVYAEKVAVDEQVVPFSKCVPYSQTKIERFTPDRAAPMVGLVIGAFTSAMLGVLEPAAFFVAGFLAIFAVVAYRALAPVEREITVQGVVDVSGTVTMRADYWQTFPDNTRVFPKDFGNAVRVVMPSEPTIYYEGQ